VQDPIEWDELVAFFPSRHQMLLDTNVEIQLRHLFSRDRKIEGNGDLRKEFEDGRRGEKENKQKKGDLMSNRIDCNVHTCFAS
jgi:hypothetical protein